MSENILPLARSGFKNITLRLLDFIIPPRCSLCLCPDTNGFCHDCQPMLPWKSTCCRQCGTTLAIPGLCGSCQKDPPSYSETVVPFEYSDPIAHYIHLLKYHHQLSYGRTLGLILATYVVRNCRSIPDALVPVPLYNSKLRQRGFNQAEMIAQTAGRLLEVKVDNKLLKRVRNTDTQTSLELLERRKNMHNAFAVAAPGRYDSIAVIDDVITSGATMNAACSALKYNDYNTISAWSIAKT